MISSRHIGCKGQRFHLIVVHRVVVSGKFKPNWPTITLKTLKNSAKIRKYEYKKSKHIAQIISHMNKKE